MPSRINIKNKITFSFVILLLLMSTTVVIAYFLVQQVERKLYQVEIIDGFFNLTLELRRYEKNYFLYHLEEDYRDNIQYLDQLDETVQKNSNVFAATHSGVEAEQVDTVLLSYRENMSRLHALHQNLGAGSSQSPEGAQLLNAIRESGKKLTLMAEQMASRERASIQNLLRTSWTVLFSTTGTVIFISFLMAMLLREKIVNSLKLLEVYTRKVAHGEMVDPPDIRVEEEIRSLFQAFTRMNNELRLRQRQMVQSEKLASLGTLLAGVAHELNNPLSNISTSAQILTEEIDNPDREFHATLVRQIEEQTDKARDIVRTLLEFSRTGKFQKQQLNLNDVAASAIRLLRSEIPSEMSIELDIPADLMVWMDKQRMQQVFLNLIKNAVDACGSHGKIWITAREFYSEGHKEVEILVSDNGPGIPPQDVEKIFDPFFTSKDVGKGSGLGLFIVHDIIESHGGTITVDSRLDEGTTFIIWLPGETTAA
ncbi:MAG: sensor histidine kinase [Desulfobulbaceae bacterium]